jgi:hypothetical protein
MDPDKRLTCGQLLQHQYFDGFNNEFDRERKERQKQLDREQQKLLQQQAKLQNNVYVSNTKQQNPGVSLLKCNKNEFFLYWNIFPFAIRHAPGPNFPGSVIPGSVIPDMYLVRCMPISHPIQAN